MDEELKGLAELVIKLDVSDLIIDHIEKKAKLLSPDNLSYVRNRWALNPVKKSELSNHNLQVIADEVGIDLDDLDQELLDEIHRQSMPDMPDNLIVEIINKNVKVLLDAVMIHVKELELKLLKEDKHLYMRCLLDLTLVITKSLVFFVDVETYRKEINAILSELEITSIDNEVDLLFEAFRGTSKIDEALSAINESEFLMRHSKSGLSNIEVPKVLDYRMNRYLDLFSYGKDYLKSKKELQIKIEPNLLENITKPLLSIPQIAVILALKQVSVTRDNADELIASYGHKSGDKLYNTYCMHNETSKRISPPLNSSSVKKLQNKIDLFESVIDHLDGKDRERLISEIEMLRKHLNDFY